MRQLWRLGAVLFTAQAAIAAAIAGPPFRTDDPEPVETQRWEINLFSLGTFSRNDRLTVGAEVFHQTSNTRSTPDTTGYNLGGTYGISEHLRVLMTVGSGLQNTAATNHFSYYAGLQVTF